MTITTNMISSAMQGAASVSKRFSRGAMAQVANVMPVVKTVPAYQPRSLSLLGQHIKNSLQLGFFSRIYDLTNLRFNLMAASSLVLVTCRSLVANSTARKAKGTPQEVYRYQEAVKTTFREFLTFAMTYVILMYAQRFVVDGLRNLLWIRKGVTRMPTAFNPLLQTLCGVPKEFRNNLKNEVGPTIGSTFREIANHIKDYRNGKQILPKNKMELKQKWIQSEVLTNSIEMDMVNRKQQYDFVYKVFVKPISWIANKDPRKLTQEETLKLLFEWAPPLLGAIPAIILSGFYSEMATQKYAEPFARFVAGLRNKNKPEITATAPSKPFPQHNAQFNGSNISYPTWAP